MPKKIVEQDEEFYKLAHTIADEIDAAMVEEAWGSDYNFEDVEDALEFSETYGDLLGTVEDILYEKGILVERSIVEEGPDEEEVGGEEGEEGERTEED